jgi:hypothetical protein
MRPEKKTEREQGENRERTRDIRVLDGVNYLYFLYFSVANFLRRNTRSSVAGKFNTVSPVASTTPFKHIDLKWLATQQEQRKKNNNNNKREYQARKETMARSTLPGNVFRLQRFPKFLQSCFVVFGQRRFRSDDLHFANQMASVAGGTNETAALALGVQGQGLILVRQGRSGTSEIGGGGQWWCGERCRCSGRGC